MQWYVRSVLARASLSLSRARSPLAASRSLRLAARLWRFVCRRTKVPFRLPAAALWSTDTLDPIEFRIQHSSKVISYIFRSSNENASNAPLSKLSNNTKIQSSKLTMCGYEHSPSTDQKNVLSIQGFQYIDARSNFPWLDFRKALVSRALSSVWGTDSDDMRDSCQ